jgi:hypothetical protein
MSRSVSSMSGMVGLRRCDCPGVLGQDYRQTPCLDSEKTIDTMFFE